MHGLEHELRQHASALRALALRLVGPAHADDLVQETSLLAWTQRPDERGGLGGWLRSVLRHRAGKLQRGSARRTRREQVAARDDVAPSPLDVAAQREATAALHDALMALPAPYQGVLLQRFFQDLPPSAIAATNGVPLATVKSHLQRGLALLRDRLDADRRGDWRGAFAGAFGLPRGSAPVVAVTAGAILMSTKSLWLGGAAVAALLGFAMWPDAGVLPQTPAPSSDRAVVATATSNPTAGAAPERHEASNASPPTAAPAAAPLRIRLVDAFDGAPLPAFWVHIESTVRANERVLSCSDDAGELTIDGEFRDHESYLIAVDDPRADADVETAPRYHLAAGAWPEPGSRVDVPFAVGPTYRLLFDTPPPDGGLEAVLVPGHVARVERGEQSHAVRSGSPPWVRLSAFDANPSQLGEGPWTLFVFGRAWIASGPVLQIRGVQPTPVMLHGCAQGTLHAEATVDGRSVAGEQSYGATVYPLDDAGVPVDDGGRTIDFRRSSLEVPAGRYRVFVFSADGQIHREDVTVVAARTTVVRAAFLAATAKLTLQVVLRSQTGTRQVGNLPEARRVGGTERAYGTYLHEEGGASVYQLAGLQPGEWDVELGPTPHLPPWDATVKRVSAEAGTVEFVCLDAGAPPPGNGRVRVIDAVTKAPIDGAGVTTVQDGMHFGAETGRGRDGIAFLGPCLAGRAVHVLVRAAGYAPAWFDLTPVAESEPPPHEVALSPGWGTLLTVVRPSTEHSRGEPLAGVRVMVDGALAGTTDPRGFLLLSTTSRPARLEFVHDEYVHDHGGADATTGAPDGDAQHPFFVVMKKKQK